MIRFTRKDDALIFTVRVAPRASKSEIVGAYEGALKIRLAAPPIGGAANTELIKLLSKTFDVPKSAVENYRWRNFKDKTNQNYKRRRRRKTFGDFASENPA